MPIKRRAINDEQKQERRQALLDTAWQLLQSSTYDAINMLDVAEKAGLAKGTVYLYFATKEALFLAVLEQQFGLWFEEMDRVLDSTPQSMTRFELVSLLVNSFTGKPRLAYLFSIAHVILEHNIDYESALKHKRMLRDKIARTGGLLEKRLTCLQPGQGAELLLRIYALLIGIENLARPAPIVQQVISENADLAVFNVDFAHEIGALSNMLLHYYETQKGEENGR